MTSKAELDAVTAKIATLQRLNLTKFRALDTIIDLTLSTERAQTAADRGVRGRLLSRLQAKHECRQPDGGQFEQIEPLGKVRQWRCSGCARIVTLDEKVSA